jgi:hypothetical protein
MRLADVRKQWSNSVDSSCPPIGSISVLLSALQCYGLDSRTSRTCITWVRLRPRVTMVYSYLPTHALVKRDSAETFPSAVEEKSPNISPAPPPPKPKQWVTPESRATRVRVGVDQAFGRWNSPVDPETNEFVYVPIPESRAVRAALATPYSLVQPALARFAAAHPGAPSRSVQLPSNLILANMPGE